MKTREAYKVIVERIEAKTRSNKACNCWFAIILVGSFIFYSWLIKSHSKNLMPVIILNILGGIIALCFFSVRRAQMKKDEEVKKVAILRRGAAGPSSALQLPDWLQERQNKRSGGTTFNDSPAYYGGAAACGVSNTG